MPSLREILERQKREKSNAKQSILQRETLKATPQKEVPEGGKAQIEVAKTAEGIVPEKAGEGERIAPSSPPVLPPGLSGIAKLKWLRENGPNVQKKSGNNSGNDGSVKSVGGADKPIDTGNVQSKLPETTPSIGHREAEKTNDGNIDVDKLKDSLVYLANNIEQKEIVAQVVRSICVQIKNNPSITPFMKKSDVDLIVRGVRMAYQVAARKKSEKSEGKTVKDKVTSELADAFKAAGLNLNFGG